MMLPENPRCDFCYSTVVVRSFDCDDFTMAVGWIDENDKRHLDEHASKGSWASCGVCASLIDEGDKEALIKRACLQQHGDEERAARVRPVMEAWLDGFWEHKK